MAGESSLALRPNRTQEVAGSSPASSIHGHAAKAPFFLCAKTAVVVQSERWSSFGQVEISDDERSGKARVQAARAALGGGADVEMTALSLHPMRRKWTSCATAGALSFSTELLGLESELIDYGILHEPLHLRVGDLAGLHGVLHEVGTVVLPTGPVSTYTGKIG
jgi:hypothetical protein